MSIISFNRTTGAIEIHKPDGLTVAAFAVRIDDVDGIDERVRRARVAIDQAIRAGAEPATTPASDPAPELIDDLASIASILEDHQRLLEFIRRGLSVKDRSDYAMVIQRIEACAQLRESISTVIGQQ